MAKRPYQKKKSSDHATAVTRAAKSSFVAGRQDLSTCAVWLPRVLLITAVTLWIYWPALHGDWVWDDDWYITTNPLMHGWTGLWKFWCQPGSWVEYYPIQETVQWVQWQLWGNDTLGYHLTNVFLHIVNALLVWRLLAKFGLRLAWLGGLIFAVHPVQVESVAWISELKNTLSLPFFLLAMITWIDYEEHHRKKDYQAALGLFLVAMLCKITMAPFPMIILLYAWWKRGRVGWNDLKASGPFFVISVGLGILGILVATVYAEVGHALPDHIPLGGFFSRLAGAGLIMAVYFSRSILPVDVLLAYPKWPVNPHSLLGYLPWLVLSIAIYWFWNKRKTWGRHALLGLGFFLIMLGPFLGFRTISYMSFTWVMDHFLYIPLIGIIGLLVAGLGDLETKLPSWAHACVIGGAACFIALMALESRAFAGLFLNEETLWSYTLQRNPDAWLAHDNLGGYFLEKERFPEAVMQFNETVRLNPDFDEGHYNLGLALDKLGKTAEAQEQYRQAIRLNPGNGKAYLNLGEIMRREDKLPEAEEIFRQGLALAPDNAALYTDLGDVLLRTGRVPEAIDLYRQAVELNPDLAALRYNLGNVLLQTGHLSEALEQLQAAVTLDPKVVQAHENLGVALAQSGQLSEAIEQFEAVLQLEPAHAAARDNLGLALAQTGHIPEAIDQFQQALQANPNDAVARQSLTKLQQYELRPNAPGQK